MGQICGKFEKPCSKIERDENCKRNQSTISDPYLSITPNRDGVNQQHITHENQNERNLQTLSMIL